MHFRFNQPKNELSNFIIRWAVLVLFPFFLHADPWGKDADLPFISQTLTEKIYNGSAANMSDELNKQGMQSEKPLLHLADSKENRTLKQQHCKISVDKSPLSRTAEGLIWFHQNVISQADGPRSHFVPSSSQYTLEAIRKYGFLKGYLLGCDRLMRENREEWIYSKTMGPYCILKYDPVP